MPGSSPTGQQYRFGDEAHGIEGPLDVGGNRDTLRPGLGKVVVGDMEPHRHNAMYELDPADTVLHRGGGAWRIRHCDYRSSTNMRGRCSS
ncbi:hypothetical protein PG984_002211 [Apiospora sp. TS-2023a]